MQDHLDARQPIKNTERVKGQGEVTQWEIHPSYYLISDPTQIEPWLEQAGFNPAAAVLGCAAMGSHICPVELTWMASRLSSQDKPQVIFAIDPSINEAIGKYKQGFYELAGVGLPQDIDKYLNIKVALLSQFSGYPDLFRSLENRLDQTFVLAPLPSTGVGQIGDAYGFLKPGGVLTVVLRAKDFCDLEGKESYEDMGVKKLLKSLQRSFRYNPRESHTENIARTLAGADINLQHLAQSEYLETYPPSRLLQIAGANDDFYSVLTIQKPI